MQAGCWAAVGVLRLSLALEAIGLAAHRQSQNVFSQMRLKTLDVMLNATLLQYVVTRERRKDFYATELVICGVEHEKIVHRFARKQELPLVVEGFSRGVPSQREHIFFALH